MEWQKNNNNHNGMDIKKEMKTTTNRFVIRSIRIYDLLWEKNKTPHIYYKAAAAEKKH